MVVLENEFGHFGEFGSSNLEVGFNEKYIDNEDPKEIQKEIEKEIPSSSVVTSSQYLFKV